MARSTSITRLGALLRGVAFGRVRSLEEHNPAAVYEVSIQRSLEQHGRLRDAVARLLYLQRRLDSRLADHRLDLNIVDGTLNQAVELNNDETALTLIDQKQTLLEAIAAAEARRGTLGAQIDAAKESLDKLTQAVTDLRRERTEMLSQRAHAQARVDTVESLRGSLAGSADVHEALENVHEKISQAEALADLNEHSGGRDKGNILDERRAGARREANLEALAALHAARARSAA